MLDQNQLPDWFYSALNGESAEKTILDCRCVLEVVCNDLALEPIAINEIVCTNKKAADFYQRLKRAAVDAEWEGLEILLSDFSNNYYIGENFAIRRRCASGVELYLLHSNGELDTIWGYDVMLIGESPLFVANKYGAIGTVTSDGHFVTIVDGDTGWGDGEDWGW